MSTNQQNNNSDLNMKDTTKSTDDQKAEELIQDYRKKHAPLLEKKNYQAAINFSTNMFTTLYTITNKSEYVCN